LIEIRMIIEQFLPTLHYGDAIGNSAMSLHAFFQSRGMTSRIISLAIDECMQDQAILFRDYREEPQSLKILHFAVPSELTDFFLRTGGKKAMIYHNITPAHFFVDFSDTLVQFTQAGREHLRRLSRCFDISIADSAYNAGELRDLAFANVHVFPLLIDLADYEKPHSRPFYNLFKDERKNIVFVGRIVPNKKIEDLIKVLFFYKKYLSPAVRLIVAGSPRTVPAYFYAVRDLAARFYLTAEDIVFPGHIPFAELLSVYRLADLFLSMSEHEGFCLPLIECCYFQVPVMAYNAGAVKETLGDAGVLLHHKNYASVAGLAERVMNDETLRLTLRNLEQKRLDRYRQESRPEKLLALLEGV